MTDREYLISILKDSFRNIITEDMRYLWKLLNRDTSLNDELVFVESAKDKLEIFIAILVSLIKGTTFELELDAFRKYHKELYEEKKLEYESGNQTNLSIISKELNMSPKIVAFILAMKHYSSLVLKNEWTEEFIYEKMGDLHNYLYLIERLIRKEMCREEI